MADNTVLNGRYELVAVQGSGGMSVIYRAVDRALGRTVAIKILRPSLITQRSEDGSFLEKFRNEARAIAALEHPNIVTVYDVGNSGSTYYMVMELVKGTDLKKVIKEKSPLPIPRALHIATQMCAGIGYAHRTGLVHADVKPQNILIGPEDAVKVTDFGIAQVLTNTQPMKRNEIVWGSPHYFAPEQARGDQPTPAADVYAIGIVLFEMLTGRLPYSGTNQQELAMAHIREPIPPVTQFNPHVPASLAQIIQKVMSKDPNGRYATADQLGNVLKKYQDRANEHTAVNPQVPHYPTVERNPSPETPPPSQPSQPPQANIPPVPADRIGNAEVTARYSPAPNAPRPYDPRNPYHSSQDPSVPAPHGPAQAPQNPDRFIPPAQPQDPAAYPAPQPIGDSSAYYPSQASRPIALDSDNEGLDYVTIVLAILAVVAVAGLVLLWIVVLATR